MGLGEAAARMGDRVASLYAGDTDFVVQQNAADNSEAKKKLESLVEGVPELAVHKLAQAYERGDKSMIVAGLSMIWENNWQAEMAQNSTLVEVIQKGVKARAAQAARRQGLDVKKSVAQALRHLENNFTSQQYMNIFCQELLTRAYRKYLSGDELAVNEQMKLDQTSIAKGGVAQFGNAGQGVFYEPQFRPDLDGQFRAMVDPRQRKAILAKLDESSGENIGKLMHPDLLITRTTDGRLGSLTDIAIGVIGRMRADDFSKIVKWRPDVIQALNSPQIMGELERAAIMLDTAQGGREDKLSRQIKAFMVTMMAIDRGLVIDKGAAKLFGSIIGSDDPIDLSKQLPDLVEDFN